MVGYLPWSNETERADYYRGVFEEQLDICKRLQELNEKLIASADVAEVKHGEWIDNKIPNSILDECSECGFSCGAYTFNYCPMCGAKMDGGKI